MNKINITKDWLEIRKHFNKSFRTNFHIAIASVNNKNLPDVTPVGSLFLNHDQSGFYFEKYPEILPKNAEYNQNICVLGVNSNMWFWLKSLFKAKFNSFPAIKLYGELGERRKATENEIKRLKRRMKTTRILKGNSYLWGSMHFVRDIKFTDARITQLGKMTEHL